MVLAASGAAAPLLVFVEHLYSNVRYFTTYGRVCECVFGMLAGVFQGFPGLGALFAIGGHPFLVDLFRHLEQRADAPQHGARGQLQ
eukprot:5409213-Pyramimonas_sp.AAC.1